MERPGLLPARAGSAETASRTVEDGGTGPFPALMVADSTLATHTIFRPKDHLDKLHAPVIYILCDEKDIAYPNGMDDFRRINRIPAFMANLNVGHGGTYAQPHGGDFAMVATAWFQRQLKGDTQPRRCSKAIHAASQKCPDGRSRRRTSADHRQSGRPPVHSIRPIPRHAC